MIVPERHRLFIGIYGSEFTEDHPPTRSVSGLQVQPLVQGSHHLGWGVQHDSLQGGYLADVVAELGCTAAVGAFTVTDDRGACTDFITLLVMGAPPTSELVRLAHWVFSDGEQLLSLEGLYQ